MAALVAEDIGGHDHVTDRKVVTQPGEVWKQAWLVACFPLEGWFSPDDQGEAVARLDIEGEERTLASHRCVLD